MKFVLAIVLVIVVGPVRADEMTMNDFLSLTVTSDTAAKLVGVSGESYAWANTRLDVDGNPMLFCVPSNLGITDGQYVSILKTYIQKHSWFGNDNWRLFPSHLLAALIEVFPC